MSPFLLKTPGVFGELDLSNNLDRLSRGAWGPGVAINTRRKQEINRGTHGYGWDECKSGI